MESEKVANQESEKAVNQEKSRSNVDVNRWVIFIDNLSRRVSRVALKELFEHYGSVQKIFIPMVNNKPKYRFCTFALIHMGNEKDMIRAIEKTHNSLIDGRKVAVSKAKFPEPRKTLNAQQRKNDEYGPSSGGSRSGGKGKAEKNQRSFKPAWRDKRSFKEVLLNGSSKKRNSSEGRTNDNNTKPDARKKGSLLDIAIPVSENQWIKNYMICIIKSSFDREFVQKALASDGLKVRLAKCGVQDNFCVITFNSLVEKDNAWEIKKEELSFWFEYLDFDVTIDGIPWGFCVVSLLGVPIQCWYEGFFTELAKRWGVLIKIHEQTLHKLDLFKAKLLLRTPSQFDIPSSISLQINCIKYLIGIKMNETFPENEFMESGNEDVPFADVWPEQDNTGRTFQDAEDR
ncbi:hypothetical protein HRI_001264200 [Hibiscus trionum]|uniref:RRM domain-containing protein n=1 Tax=Hibiscus trionum TaxID=183268 RepID=A0A9W7LSW1_HIBTR|nr:hypothetical protein HRI_001264200 [Hibiscus trionum]